MSVTVKLKYFGVIAEETGKAEETLELKSNSADVNSIKAHCYETYSISDRESIQVAVNHQMGKGGALKDGDEVAFLPPFSGG